MFIKHKIKMMKKIFCALCLCFLALTSNELLAQAKNDFGMEAGTFGKGLALNTLAPQINAVDFHGKAVNSEEILKDKKLVVVFYRGHWCPLCNRHLSKFVSRIDDFNAQGAEIIFITPESKEYMAKTNETFNNKLRLISDADGELMKKFDVAFKATEAYQAKVKKFVGEELLDMNAQDEAILPVPATYVINQEGKIIFKQFEYNYSNRSEVEDILKIL